MKRLLALAFLALAPAAALADLYRWVDPQSGSVKLSSVPPPWYGDPAREGRSPKVQVIPYSAASRPAPIATPAPFAPAPAATVAPPAPAAAGDGGMVGALEARLRALQQGLAGAPRQADFDRSGEALQQQVKAYEAVAAELDRIDPGGAARRRAQEASFAEQMKKALEAQFSTKPPAVK